MTAFDDSVRAHRGQFCVAIADRGGERGVARERRDLVRYYQLTSGPLI